MFEVSLEEAQTRLVELVEKAQTGAEIVITRNDQPVAKLVGQSSRPACRLGTLKGTVLYMAPDFDAPLNEFKDYMP